MKKRRRRGLKKGISIGVTAFCLIAAGCLALLLTPIFDVQTVTVTGNRTLASEDIVKNSGIVTGTNIFQVSLRAVGDRLTSMEGIDTVKVRRSLPSTVRIAVTEGTPLVYVEQEGTFVGITADGKVVDVAEAGSAAASVLAAGSAPAPSVTEEKDGGDSEDDGAEDESGVEDGEDTSAAAPAVQTGKTVVRGMGGFKYSVGRPIDFDDEVKGEKLALILSDFMGDELCRGFTAIDMSVYDNVILVYRGRLKVRLGAVERLDYKLKCFKTLITDNIGEDAGGTLDLELLRYNPKKF